MAFFKKSLFLLCLISLLLDYLTTAELLMVQTLTRHGERAPDKIISQQSCRTIFKSGKDILKKFHAAPGRLTPLGIERMRAVGSYIRARYIEGRHWEGKWQSVHGFVDSDYQMHQGDWSFVARAGFRQQRSMWAIVEGIFPSTPVPISVDPRVEDAVLGGPAPACGSRTAKMIVDWHKTKGWEYLKDNMDIIEEIEAICDVNLTGNPVNAKPGGPNPHAWIGDISDSLDSAWSCGVPLPKTITPKLHEQITDLAFAVQEGSHYDDPQGATMFAGAFPETLLSMFERFDNVKPGKKRPKKTPKMQMFSCSRELMYGLEKMFGWKTELPGQPKGRVVSGTTFIWELHREVDIFDTSKTGLLVRSYWWNPTIEKPVKLQEDISLKTFRERYEAYISENGGSWKDICDFEHFNEAHAHHDSDYINPKTNIGHESNLVSANIGHESNMVSATNGSVGYHHSSFFSESIIIIGVCIALFAVGPKLYRKYRNDYQQI